MTKITKREFGLLERTLRSAFENVRIENNYFELIMDDEMDKPLTFSISWKNLGNKTVEEAEAFMQEMSNAMHLAKSLNDMKIYVDYEAQDIRITTKEDYLIYADKWAKNFKGGSAVAFAFFIKG